MAMALVRYSFRGRELSNLLIVVPMATPEVVLGAALLSLFLLVGIGLGFVTILIAHVMFCISFVVVTVRSRLIGFDRHLEEAAMDLGAPPLTTFRTVTLPLILPGVLAGGLLAFALSIDDFVITNFNSGTTVTFPLYIWGAARIGIPPQVNIMATLIFAVTVLAMGFAVWQQRRAEKLASTRIPDDQAEPPGPQAAIPAPAAGHG
jgi:spermidine/putrescine transport system permease protein